MLKDKAVEITDAEELARLLADASALGRPYVVSHRTQGRIRFYANAEELRKWRGSFSTSEGDASGKS